MQSDWSIRGRLFGLWLLMLLLVSVAVYLTTSAVVERSLQTGQDRNLKPVALIILDSVVNSDQGIDFDLPYQAFEVLAYSAPERIFYRVTLGERNLAGYDDVPADLQGSEPIVFQTHSYRGESTRFVTARKRVFSDSDLEVTVTVGQTRASYLTQAQQIANWIALAVLIAFACLAVWAEASLRHALKPVVGIAADLEVRKADDFSPIQARVPMEISRLVETLNRVFDQHRGLLAENRAFIAEATHQIKTPIAAIMTRSELLERELPETHRAEAHDLTVRARYASKLVTQLLLRASLTYRELVGAKEWIDLMALLQGIVRAMDPTAEAKEVAIHLHASESVPSLYADRVAIREAVICLLDNAIRHTPALTDVDVEVSIVSGKICIAILDRGPGFPSDDLDAVKLASEDGHVGLGLEIVNRVARSHNGELTISDRPDGGAKCVISLPVS